MDKDTEQYYEQLLDLFLHPGWKQFQQDFEESFDLLEKTARKDCPTNDQWQYRRGQLEQLDRVITFEQLIRAAYDDLTED